MTHEAVAAALRSFIAEVIMEGDDAGLDATTPLLELGVIDSYSVIDLLAFIETRFDVKIADDSLTEANPKHIDAIAALVMAALVDENGP